MENKSKARVVGNVAIKSILVGALLGGWAGLFVQTRNNWTGWVWALTPAILSLILSLLLVTVGRRFLPRKVSKVLEEKPGRAIWIGFGLAFLLLIILTSLAAFFIFARATSGQFALIPFVVVGFELLGGLIGAAIFLILGVIIGLIKVFRSAKAGGRTLPGMQPRPPFDRALLIPIAIGVVSILGIRWIFLTSDLRETFIPPTAVPTAIPFDVSSLETEAASFFPSATPTQNEAPPTVTGTRPVAYPGPLDEKLPSTGTLSTEKPPAPSATPTPGGIQPLAAGRRYDDTDPNIAYDAHWTALKNPGTKNAYKGTLHASNAIGNEASFRFTGKEFRLGYQRGKNFGTVTVLVDNQSYSFNEQAFDLVWRSPQLSPGDHFVRIIHESGESINLDYIDILD